jgi:hypothetical protein
MVEQTVKLQNPTLKIQGNFKIQISSGRRNAVLVKFEIWSFPEF